MAISVIAGLGNPGAAYHHTRHNIGFQVVDVLAEHLRATWQREQRCKALVANVRIAGQPIHLLKPQTYMNASGASLAAFLRFYKLPDSALAVVYDEINLDRGRLKLSIGGSDGGHNGIADIMRRVGNEFLRYRIGLGTKTHPEMDLKDYVLGRFNAAEKAIIESQINHYIKGLELLVRQGPVLAMNHLNIRPNRKKANESDSNEE